MTTATVGGPSRVFPRRHLDGGPESADGRWPWSVTVSVAAATTGVALLSLLVVAGSTVPAWQLLGAPISVGAAVVLSRVRVELAIGVLGVALLAFFGPAYTATSGAGVWQMLGGFALFFGICWVTGSVGRQLELRWSAPWMAWYVAAVVIGLGFDAPITMLGIGWWLVGISFRHSAQLTARLHRRAIELAEEQDRFADEAVRLERSRIARELHDVVAHCMTVIVIQARAGRQLAEADAAAADEALDAILITAREAASDLDALVGVMDASSHPLTRNLLETLVQRAASGGADVRLELRGDPDDLEATEAAVAHRVMQEALTNALRHAPGSPVQVVVDCRAGLTVTVTNAAGTHGSPPTVGSGRGLAGIAERVAGLGGIAAWGPTSAGGWELSVRLSRRGGRPPIGRSDRWSPSSPRPSWPVPSPTPPSC